MYPICMLYTYRIVSGEPPLILDPFKLIIIIISPPLFSYHILVYYIYKSYVAMCITKCCCYSQSSFRLPGTSFQFGKFTNMYVHTSIQASEGLLSVKYIYILILHSAKHRHLSIYIYTGRFVHVDRQVTRSDANDVNNQNYMTAKLDQPNLIGHKDKVKFCFGRGAMVK